MKFNGQLVQERAELCPFTLRDRPFQAWSLAFGSLCISNNP